MLLLALWLGAAAFFAAAVAPAVFAVLPSRALAGAVVGRTLPAVFYSGMIIGVLAIVAGGRPYRQWTWRDPEIAAVGVIGACAIAQLVIAPRIERVRASIGGVLDDLPIDDARRVAFGRLHGLSVAWLGVAMLAAAWALFVAARRLSQH
jgi:hypothetical protein